MSRASTCPRRTPSRRSDEPTFHQVATVTDPLKHTAAFGYSAGRLTFITDPLNHQTTLTYHGAGQPATITTPAGTTQLGYDRAGLVNSVARW